MCEHVSRPVIAIYLYNKRSSRRWAIASLFRCGDRSGKLMFSLFAACPSQQTRSDDPCVYANMLAEIIIALMAPQLFLNEYTYCVYFVISFVYIIE